MLGEYASSGAMRYHMPGHKGVGDGILSQVYPYDITELSFSDNLADPCGVIAQAEADLAEITSAAESFIITGGSTLGVLASIYAAKRFFGGARNKIIVCKSSHKSVFNGLKLMNVEPVFLPEIIKDGLPYPCLDNFAELCDNGVIGALFTSPDYFGRCVELRSARNELKTVGGFMIVDGAHGSHLSVVNRSLYAGNYADVWVDGAHKTLKTLTQGALLNVNDERLSVYVREGLSIFGTSSPSYPIMGSVEDGYKALAETSKTTFCECFAAVEYFGRLLDSKFKIITSDDYLKICVDLCGNADGESIGKYLEENGIFAELACGRFVIFIISPDFNKEQAEKLASVMNGYRTVNITSYEDITTGKSATIRAMSFTEAANAPFEWVKIEKANGRISAEEAGLFPPCYPLITSGEVFDNGVIAGLMHKNTFGVVQGKVKVVKTDNQN